MGWHPCELWKTKRTRVHVYKHTHAIKHRHIHANTQRHTHACKDTRMHASVRSRASTHAHKVFFRDRRPEFVEPLAAHCQGGWIKFFKQILKTVVFSQSFEIPSFFLIFVTVPLTLFDLFVVKHVAKCPTSSYNTPVSTCAMYRTL